MPNTEARTHIAWLLWCLNQGYVNSEDRAILDNWLEDDPATLHPDDAKLRPHLLALADEVIAAVPGYEQGYRDGESSRSADIRIAVEQSCSLEELIAQLRRLTADPELELGSEFGAPSADRSIRT